MKKHLPNAITCCNLISGCISTTFALSGNYPMAFLFIVIGAVFDFFDGMVARLLHVSSPIGKELDSLADDITFGLAPSAMLFNFTFMMNTPDGIMQYAPYAAFIMAAFSALRLAKFNLDERQTTEFIGMPTPANALFWASLITGGEEYLSTLPHSTVWLLILSFVSCYLLVAEIPMFSLKFKHWQWKGNELKFIFIIVSIPLLLIFRLSGFAVVIALYILLSVINNAASAKTKQ